MVQQGKTESGKRSAENTERPSDLHSSLRTLHSAFRTSLSEFRFRLIISYAPLRHFNTLTANPNANTQIDRCSATIRRSSCPSPNVVA